MKINNVIEFHIDGRDEVHRFFRYAKEHNIEWVNPLGDGDFLVAYAKPSMIIKLQEFLIFYSKLNLKFNEGDRVQVISGRSKGIGTIVKKHKNAYTVLMEKSGKKNTNIESFQMIHL
jgi:hypothetical protein